MSDSSQNRFGPRAGFGTRFLAVLIDFVVLLVPNLIVLLLFKGGVATQLVSAVISVAYYTYLEGQPAGQSIGKRVMGIRVIDFATGGSLQGNTALIRSLVRIVSGIPCGLGYLWAAWDDQNQTWHDKVANTVVVPVKDYPIGV